jgi:tetratricopeptide (TPR) repeat protein
VIIRKITEKSAFTPILSILFLAIASISNAQLELQKNFLSSVDNLKTGKYSEAEEGFRELLKKEPDNLKVHYYLGIIMYGEHRLREAEAYFSWVQKRTPQMAACYYLGLIAYDEHRLDSALGYMETAHQLDPQFSLAYYYLGLIHYKKRQMDEAIGNFNNALQLQPKFAKANYALAYLYFHDLGDISSAKLHISEGLKGKTDRQVRQKLLKLRSEVERPKGN